LIFIYYPCSSSLSIHHIYFISGSKILDLCITVPTYFDHNERQAIIDAANIAGLSVISLVDQGTAVAVSYGIEQSFDPGNSILLSS
jgi:molecular chaperone DnaK (HSP70)